jgi:membrane protein involved in colicin uptake
MIFYILLILIRLSTTTLMASEQPQVENLSEIAPSGNTGFCMKCRANVSFEHTETLPAKNYKTEIATGPCSVCKTKVSLIKRKNLTPEEISAHEAEVELKKKVKKEQKEALKAEKKKARDEAKKEKKKAKQAAARAAKAAAKALEKAAAKLEKAGEAMSPDAPSEIYGEQQQ